MVCKHCKLNLLTGKQIKYCSERCGKNAAKSRYRKKYPEQVKKWRTAYNNRTENTSATEREITLKRFNHSCFRCGSKESLEVHHIKQNAGNRTFNLLVFCQKCHQDWHLLMNDFWRGYAKPGG